jgi:hypothetical protein
MLEKRRNIMGLYINDLKTSRKPVIQSGGKYYAAVNELSIQVKLIRVIEIIEMPFK